MSEQLLILVIYFYIFVCILLLLYNIVYILLSPFREKRHKRYKNKWETELKRCLSQIENGENDFTVHQMLLSKKLKDIAELISYDEAFNTIIRSSNESLIQRYLDTYVATFAKIAEGYSKKSPIEKGYFAYVISSMPFYRVKEKNALGQTLLTFFDNSTIFCRQNVLLALFKISDEQLVERAFMLLNFEEYYHPVHLLSDGLLTFCGNKEKLAFNLWVKSVNWSENVQVAIVKFATSVSGNFCEEFYGALIRNDRPYEVRFALIRYFRKWQYGPAEKYFIDYLKNNNSENLAIAVTSALSNYPGISSKTVLLQSLCSKNWYVRKNAAQSLITMGISDDCVILLRNMGDNYAADILEYYIDKNKDEKISIDETDRAL